MEPPSSPAIDVLDLIGTEADLAPMRRAVEAALSAHGFTVGELCIVLTSDEEIRELNRTHRSLDEPTDVLTFPAPSFPKNPPPPSHKIPPPPLRGKPALSLSKGSVSEANRERGDADSQPDTSLGDIVIAVPYARRQAALRGVALETELAYLAIHGVLHLAGMEDEADEGRKAMQAAMARLAARAGLPPDPDWTSLGHDSELETAR